MAAAGSITSVNRADVLNHLAPLWTKPWYRNPEWSDAIREFGDLFFLYKIKEPNDLERFAQDIARDLRNAPGQLSRLYSSKSKELEETERSIIRLLEPHHQDGTELLRTVKKILGIWLNYLLNNFPDLSFPPSDSPLLKKLESFRGLAWELAACETPAEVTNIRLRAAARAEFVESRALEIQYGPISLATYFDVFKRLALEGSYECAIHALNLFLSLPHDTPERKYFLIAATSILALNCEPNEPVWPKLEMAFAFADDFFALDGAILMLGETLQERNEIEEALKFAPYLSSPSAKEAFWTIIFKHFFCAKDKSRALEAAHHLSEENRALFTSFLPADGEEIALVNELAELADATFRSLCEKVREEARAMEETERTQPAGSSV